jgi:hypothetical protein
MRAAGLKTHWTKPQGTAAPQLWALQQAEALRGVEEMAATGKGRTFERIWCRIEGADDARTETKLPCEREVKLQVATLCRPRDCASSLGI